MSQTVVIRGNVFPDTPAVKIPIENGGGAEAYFYDTSDATITSGGQVAKDVIVYGAEGQVTGTAEERTSSDLTASGATVTAPAGIYSAAASKTITTGRVTAPSTISGTSATVSTGNNTLTLSKTISVTPNVTSAGYISSGTAGNASVSLTASVTTKAAATITPGTTAQTIASGTYLTGTQTIAGDANLRSENIVAGRSIFNVNGSAQIPVISQDATTKILSIS